MLGHYSGFHKCILIETFALKLYSKPLDDLVSVGKLSGQIYALSGRAFSILTGRTGGLIII